MQRVSFFDRKKTDVKEIISFSFWERNTDFILDREIITSLSELQERLKEYSTDVLIAVCDAADDLCAEKLCGLAKKIPRTKIIILSRDASYKTVRRFFKSGVFDYITIPAEEKNLEETILGIYEDKGAEYVVNNLKLRADALIDNIFLGGGQEDFIITGIISQIYQDWNNDPVNCQLVSDKAKNYIYETMIERKPWLEKFLFKDDFTSHFGFSLKDRNELIKKWSLNFKEASAMVTKYQMIDDKLVYKIGKYAVVHVDEHLSLDDVSKGVFLNSSYISHIFKKVTGMNFTDFMTEVKIDRAKVLLRDQKIRINEVAYILGFANQEYFSKNFKRKTGMTPSLYKEFLMEKYSG